MTRFNFTYFRNIYTAPIVKIVVAEDLHSAVVLYNDDPDQLSTTIYEDSIDQIDENTWFHGPLLNNANNRSGCVIAIEKSKFFNIGIYLSVFKNILHRNTHQSLFPSFSELVGVLLFPSK